MTGTPPQVDVVPVLTDSEAMRFFWESALRKHNVLGDLENVPQNVLNEVYLEVARSAVTLSSIMNMLQKDETTRYSYAVAKNKLGLKDIKLSQLSNEALDVIEHAMTSKFYGTGPSQRKRYYSSAPHRRGAKRTASYPARTYHKMTYVPGSGTGLYDTRKGVYANYGHRNAQSTRIYEKHYSKAGQMRMRLRMLPISPETLKYRRKDLFYYYK